MSRRVAGRAWVLVVFALLAGLLVACQKPLPTITVYGDGKSIIVDAASYQFTGGPTHRPISDYGQAPTLTVAAGSELLIDVPRDIAKQTWIVAAFTLDQDGKSTALEGAGTAVPIHDQHTTRLSSAPAGVGEYYLGVAELRGTAQTGGWVVKIRTKA